MKNISSNHSSKQIRNRSTVSINDKENQPTKLKAQFNTFNERPATKKIGQQIRSRIQQPPVQREPLIVLKQNQLVNGSSLRRCQSELYQSNEHKRVKSVSFDQLQRAPITLQQNQSVKKSILKKSISQAKRPVRLHKSQLSVADSHTSSQDQSIQNSINNKTIHDRYETILYQIKKSNKKFKDQVYPPVQSSIYLNNSLMKKFCEMFEKQGRTIEWMRVSKLYSNKECVLWNSQPSEKSTIINGCISKTQGDSDFLAAAFNSISSKNTILEKIFENQKINKECIYRLKIYQTQTNIWKYIVLDDYIPVIINTKMDKEQKYLPENIKPAFLDVIPQGNKVEIWPFLLQKAYAKYYSTYDSLANGNTLDFLEEITGCFLEKMPFRDNAIKVSKLIQNQDAILLGEDQNGIVHPIKNLPSNGEIIYLNRESDYTPTHIPSCQSKFTHVHFCQLHKYYNTSRCQVQQQSIKTRVKKNKQTFILRQFTLNESCECQLALVQKEQRFFRSYLTYEYAWMRVVLVQKENNSYRWVKGTYSNKKSAKIAVSLIPGQYVVIILPEWPEKPQNFNLIFKGTTQTIFQRKSYDLYHNILEQSCMDVSQREGKLVQVNKNICSYHHIEQELGLIIENINNQKEKGWIRIVRSVEGLHNYGIVAFNSQFANKKSAEIIIPNRNHYTVILMTTRGVQKHLLEMFDFGSEHN